MVAGTIPVFLIDKQITDFISACTIADFLGSA
jgi:hypothetical protein